MFFRIWKLEHKNIFIPDAETLKQSIREQIHPYSPSMLAEEICDPQVMETGYHGLFVRLGQEGMKGKIKAVIFQATRFLTLWQERINQNIHRALLGVIMAVASMRQQQDQLSEELSGLKDKVKEQLDEHRRLMFQQQRDFEQLTASAGTGRGSAQTTDKHSPVAIREGGHAFLDGLYVAFENRFRGSREAIKHRLAVYLPIVVGHFNPSDIRVLDVGCGRGEWLEILKENGITAQGIDTNRFAVSQCREYGLDALEADVLAHLKAVPESSLHAVTGFHIIEHLAFEETIALLDEVHRVLKPGGAAIFETPNPANILVSAYDFYRDPSHKNPVHPQTIQFFAEFRGFQTAAIRLVEQQNDQCRLIDFDTWRLDTIQNYIDIPRDYALIAQKKA